jgi:hypothetical protein
VSGLGRRVRRLEERALAGDTPETEREREERLELIRDGAERTNDRRRREGEKPIFEITEEGDVLCAHDGKPVTSYYQTLAEDWYWEQLKNREDGVEDGFTYDPEREVFYGADGEVALSREAADLERFFRYLAW